MFEKDAAVLREVGAVLNDAVVCAPLMIANGRIPIIFVSYQSLL
jgi:hypothetical protein